MVPINKKLDPINKENRLMRAVFTDLWDEFMFTGTGDVETKFQNFFFPPKKDRNDNPKSRRSERLRYYRMFYSHPYPDKRMKGYDFKPPKVIVQQDALSKIDLQNEAFQSLEDNVDPSLRALTDDGKIKFYSLLLLFTSITRLRCLCNAAFFMSFLNFS